MQGWILTAFWPLIFVMSSILVYAAADIITDGKQNVKKERLVKVIRLKRKHWTAKCSFVQSYKATIQKTDPTINELIAYIDEEV